MSPKYTEPRSAFACHTCGMVKPAWVIRRVGDAAISWACGAHLSGVCRWLQRQGEDTELTLALRREA